MKNSVNSNMYAAGLLAGMPHLEGRLRGGVFSKLLVVSWEPLPELAYKALVSSAVSLGYRETDCAFLAIGPLCSLDSLPAPDTAENASHAQDTGQGKVERNVAHAALSATEVFCAIEGTDPAALVIADAPSAAQCAEAYRCPIPTDTSLRLLCRSTVVFTDFVPMLASTAEKQRAWALLKKLPRA